MYNAPVLKKAIEVIKLIVKYNKPLGVTDIAKRLSISKSTTFGILKTLEQENFIVKDKPTKKYTMGKELFELSKRCLRGGELISIVKPFIEKLVGLVDETVFFTVREDNIVKVLDVTEAKKPFKISSPIGTKLPITAAAPGKIFLSQMDNKDIKIFLKDVGLPKYTENSITDIEHFIREIERTRKMGYSLDFEEYLKGIRAMATLIYSSGFPVGAILIVGFTDSMNDEKLPEMIHHLKNTAELINNRLSYFGSKAKGA
jgi:DNA-binding IclR family transcriptional regulator